MSKKKAKPARMNESRVPKARSSVSEGSILISIDGFLCDPFDNRPLTSDEGAYLINQYHGMEFYSWAAPIGYPVGQNVTQLMLDQEQQSQGMLGYKHNGKPTGNTEVLDAIERLNNLVEQKVDIASADMTRSCRTCGDTKLSGKFDFDGNCLWCSSGTQNQRAGSIGLFETNALLRKAVDLLRDIKDNQVVMKGVAKVSDLKPFFGLQNKNPFIPDSFAEFLNMSKADKDAVMSDALKEAIGQGENKQKEPYGGPIDPWTLGNRREVMVPLTDREIKLLRRLVLTPESIGETMQSLFSKSAENASRIEKELRLEISMKADRPEEKIETGPGIMANSGYQLIYSFTNNHDEVFIRAEDGEWVEAGTYIAYPPGTPDFGTDLKHLGQRYPHLTVTQGPMDDEYHLNLNGGLPKSRVYRNGKVAIQTKDGWKDIVNFATDDKKIYTLVGEEWWITGAVTVLGNIGVGDVKPQVINDLTEHDAKRIGKALARHGFGWGIDKQEKPRDHLFTLTMGLKQKGW